MFVFPRVIIFSVRGRTSFARISVVSIFPFSSKYVTIARSIAVDRLRYYRSDKRGGVRVDAVIMELSECAGNSYGGDIVDKMALSKALSEFIRSLSERNRGIFVRRYWYVDSISEIADRFSLTENAVKAILLRARRSLEKYLEKEGVKI